MVIATTRKCSSCESVGLSPVVPQGTRKLIPPAICLRISFRRDCSSSDRSFWNGVTMAVPHPLNSSNMLASLSKPNSKPHKLKSEPCSAVLQVEPAPVSRGLQVKPAPANPQDPAAILRLHQKEIP